MKRHLTIALLIPVVALAVRWRAAGQDDAPTESAAPVEVDAGDFDTLQAAIDALPAAGGKVRIPPGRYEIDKPLRIPGDDVHLQGAGTSTHIVNVNTEGANSIELLPPAPFNRSGERINRWRVQISDMRITGNEKSGHGIDAVWMNEIFLHGITVSDHGGDGVLLDRCYEDPRINDCLITYNKGVGLNLQGCHDIVVSGCHFEENGDALVCSDSFNLCMTGNNLDDHLRRGVVIENTYGSVVSGNMIEECAAAAIVLDRDCYGITLSANVIAHDGAGIELLDAHGCSVSANTFTIMKQRALYIGPESGRIAVAGNSFCNSAIGGGEVRRGTNDLAAAGVTLEGTSDIAISGNVFSGLTESALILKGDPSTRVAFTGNVLTDVTSEHEQLQQSVRADNLVDGMP